MSMCVFIESKQQYIDFASTNGQCVLLNARFNDGSPETIRLNITRPNSSFIRSGDQGTTKFAWDQPPFDFGTPSIALSFEALGVWGDCFELVHQVIGDTPIGNILAADAQNASILIGLQKIFPELLEIEKVLSQLPIETGLYDAYHNQTANSVSLSAGNALTERGERLLQDFMEAAKVYKRLPQLRSFHPDGGRAEQVNQRCAQFRQFMERTPENPLGISPQLNYVYFELKPFSIRRLRWNQPSGGDARTDSIDLLMQRRSDDGSSPVLVEVKMQDDKWASAAIQQLLYYGSAMWMQQQLLRLRRQYEQKFDDKCGLWLAALVEDRSDEGFAEDFLSSIAFCQSPKVREILGRFFKGILLIKVAEANTAPLLSWKCTACETVNWSV